MVTRTVIQVVAQVAVEAIANVEGDGYELETMEMVYEFGEAARVPDLYMEMLRNVIDEREFPNG